MGEATFGFCALTQHTEIFQSTLPVGEATKTELIMTANLRISIHASRGGSDLCRICYQRDYRISIHASRGGSDAMLYVVLLFCLLFQSTLPVGEATDTFCIPSKRLNISIHASRGGSDPAVRQGHRGQFYFNPRFPWGKRRCAVS